MWPFFMTGVYMNNKDDKEKEPIKIELENLEDLSEEEIINLINEITQKEPTKSKVSFFVRLKRLFIAYLKNLIVDFILIFTINSFIKVIDASFVNFVFYLLIYNFIDFIFNRYVTLKFPLITVLSFGVLNFAITLVSFIISGVICLQLFEIAFEKFITYFIAIIIFVLIKKFISAYLIKFRKKGKKHVSN